MQTKHLQIVITFLLSQALLISCSTTSNSRSVAEVTTPESSSINHLNNSFPPDFIFKENAISIIKLKGQLQKNKSARGTCDKPRRKPGILGWSGKIDIQNSNGQFFGSGFFIQDKHISIPLKDGIIKQRKKMETNTTVDSESWSYRNGQLIGESVYFSENSNKGTFRRVIISTDRNLKHTSQITYETGTLSSRKQDPSKAAVQNLVTCKEN